MAAVSGVAEYPDRIESVFHNTEISRNGVYALNIYALGMPHTVIIDDLLPFMPHPKDPKIVKLAYAFLGSENALWGPLVEKALAKYTGNYWHIDGGVIYEGVSMLNGSPYEQIVHQPFGSRRYVNDYWDTIRAHDYDRDIITCKSAKVQNQGYRGEIRPDHSFVIL